MNVCLEMIVQEGVYDYRICKILMEPDDWSHRYWHIISKWKDSAMLWISNHNKKRRFAEMLNHSIFRRYFRFTMYTCIILWDERKKIGVILGSIIEHKLIYIIHHLNQFNRPYCLHSSRAEKKGWRKRTRLNKEKNESVCIQKMQLMRLCPFPQWRCMMTKTRTSRIMTIIDSRKWADDFAHLAP